MSIQSALIQFSKFCEALSSIGLFIAFWAVVILIAMASGLLAFSAAEEHGFALWAQYSLAVLGAIFAPVLFIAYSHLRAAVSKSPPSNSK